MKFGIEYEIMGYETLSTQKGFIDFFQLNHFLTGNESSSPLKPIFRPQHDNKKTLR